MEMSAHVSTIHKEEIQIDKSIVKEHQVFDISVTRKSLSKCFFFKCFEIKKEKKKISLNSKVLKGVLLSNK